MTRVPTLPKRSRVRERCMAAAGLALCWGLGCSPPRMAWAQAIDLNGEKALMADTRDGTSTRIGSVFFEPSAGVSPAGRTAFRVKIDVSVMRDFFLSMREFKCLPAEAEVSCFVPYPYSQPGTIAPGDLVWLEHSLLFLYKQPRDFGAKLWNGMIFKFTPTADGKGLTGQPQAVDLNHISGPPDDLTTPPYGPMDRVDFPAGARWVTQLRVE